MPIFSYNGKTPQIGKNVFIAPTAVIVGDVTIGDNSNIWYNAVLRGDMSSIVVGQHTNIQDNSTVHVMKNRSTIIGDYVTIGHNVVLHCDQIANNCIVGMGSIMLGMSTLGENSLIMPGTMIPLNAKLPSNSIISSGSPYKIDRRLHEDEIEAIHQSALNYYSLAKTYQLKKQEMQPIG